MDYIITKLITSEGEMKFYLVGHCADKKEASAMAADEYKKFNPNASLQNIAMITEWLALKGEYSFRRDKKNRLQLALRQLGEAPRLPEAQQLVFRCISEDDLLQEIAAKLCPDGKSEARL